MSCLDVWVAAFDRLSDALEDYVACCQSINEAPPAAEEITGVDDSTGAPEYDREADEHPTEYADSEAYDAYLCGVAHRLAEKMDGAVDTVYDIILTTSNILVFATLVVLAFANVIGMGVAAVLAGGYTLVSLGEVFGFFSAMTELREALGGGDPQGLVPQTKSQLNSAYDDIVDAIFCANDAMGATNNLHAVFDQTVTSGSYRAILKLMFNGLVMRAAFAGFVNTPDRFDCDCNFTDFTFVQDIDQAALAAATDATDLGFTDIDDAPVGVFPVCAPLYGLALNTGGSLGARAVGAASYAGYSLPTSYTSHITRIEADVCYNSGGGNYLLIYADATPNENIGVSGTGSFVFTPANPEGVLANSSGGSKGFNPQGAPGNWVMTALRVYWKIVET